MFDHLSKSFGDLGSGLINAIQSVQEYFGKELGLPQPIKDSVYQLIGNTPLIKLHHFGEHLPGFNFYLKAEFTNPTGSIKDRTAYAMIVDAEKRGLLKPGYAIVETGAGTTAIGIAWLGKFKGYKVISFVYDNTPDERIHKLRSYGAEVIILKGKNQGDIQKDISEKCADIGDYWLADETKSMANPNIHYRTTGPEIWRDLAGNVDVLVSGGGSGGTITGVGRYLKSVKPTLQVVMAVPSDSVYMNPSKTGLTEDVEKLPETFDSHLVDVVFGITHEEAVSYQSELYQREGIFVGFTTGLILAAAIKYSEKLTNAEHLPEEKKNIVIISSDRD